jgi:hypothetical protein
MKCLNEASVGTAKGALNGLLLSEREGEKKMELKTGNDELGWFTDCSEIKLYLTNCKQTGFMRFEVLSAVLIKLKSSIVVLHINLQIFTEIME